MARWAARSRKDKVWFFASFEYVHENASIAYSPASTAQFNALAQLAADGLIPGVPSIAVPQTVPIPFRDYIGSLRFDWAQSSKSQWFLRTSEDNYLTHNALVAASDAALDRADHAQQLLEHACISNTYAFSPTWLGTFVFDASLLHLTQTRNSTLGFALAFPFSATSLTVSGFETFGDNQFATPITLFPSLRNQEKYQFRYDVSHATGDHSFKFGVNFIHEPVLSGAFPGNAETLFTSFRNDPTFLRRPIRAQFPTDYAAGASTTPARRRQLLAERAAPRALRAGFLARHAAPHRQLRTALADDLRTLHRLGPQPGARIPPSSRCRRCRFRCARRAARLPQAIRRRVWALPTLPATAARP